MKAMKILGWVVLVIVVFVGLSIYLTLNNLNAIVKQVVEQVGSETLQTTVSLREADIRLLDGKASLSGLSIRNLPGYSQPNLFQMETILVDLDLEAMMDQVVHVENVVVEGISIVAEQKGTTTNMQQLMSQLPKSGQGTSSQGGNDSGGDSEGAVSADIRIKIDQIGFADNSATVITEKWGENQLKIPALRLENIGGEQGVPPDQLADAILRPLIKRINKALEKGIKDLAEQKAKEKLREKEDELKAKYKDKLGADDEDIDALKSLLSR